MRYDKFEFSGDHEWARWRRGVHCAYCSADFREVEAIGVAISMWGDMIEVDPACETCAEGKNILMFDWEDN